MATTRKTTTRKASTKPRKSRAKQSAPQNTGSGRVTLSQPRSQHTALLITGEGFPPNADVAISLSKSRTPTGTNTLRSDPFGTVQVTIFPTPGEQSVTLRGGDVSATAEFSVAE